MKSKKANTFRLALMALFTAIIVIMDFTPIGYIATPFFSITLMTLPVAIGAVCIGLGGGIYLSVLFALTSFLMCFNIGFMPDKTAPLMFSASPVGTLITCFIPRILAGVITALVFKLFERKGNTSVLAFSVSCALMPLFNTVLFLTSYFICFRNTLLAGVEIKALITTAFLINGLVEIALTVIVGSVVARATYLYIKRLN